MSIATILFIRHVWTSTRFAASCNLTLGALIVDIWIIGSLL